MKIFALLFAFASSAFLIPSGADIWIRCDPEDGIWPGCCLSSPPNVEQLGGGCWALPISQYDLDILQDAPVGR